MRPGDSQALRKQRGAFFTPPAIADYLASWAVGGDSNAKVLDPTCGEAVFLLAAGRHLKRAGASTEQLDDRLFGVDLHETSLAAATDLLEAAGLEAHLVASDFFAVATPDQIDAPLPLMDAVIGNPPFVRYQEHAGEARQLSRSAALRQGVRLSGLASSWAALLVHSCAFLKPNGRLAMVLPAELLTVGYAEPIRRWLRQRFAQVHLVLFEQLQFEDATEKVVLLVAQGTGGCDAFTLWHVNDAEDLASLGPFDGVSVTPADEGKWTDLLLPLAQRQLFRRVSSEDMVSLGQYGSIELGTVTGANGFFALSESTRREYGLKESQLRRISPPGTKHLKGLTFSRAQWESLRDADEAVWLLYPDEDDRSQALRTYLAVGQASGVDLAYKCQVRSTWWRPPLVTPPDVFFTYMSHRYPRLVTNSASASFLNSMHGLRLAPEAPRLAKSALPLLSLNSVTMLGAEVHGRSYGGGILKMEPSEASALPVPSFDVLAQAWAGIGADKAKMDRELRAGRWINVVKRVDEALLVDAMGLPISAVSELHDAARSLRQRRIGREDSANGA